MILKCHNAIRVIGSREAVRDVSWRHVLRHATSQNIQAGRNTYDTNSFKGKHDNAKKHWQAGPSSKFDLVFSCHANMPSRELHDDYNRDDNEGVGYRWQLRYPTKIPDEREQHYGKEEYGSPGPRVETANHLGEETATMRQLRTYH